MWVWQFVCPKKPYSGQEEHCTSEIQNKINTRPCAVLFVNDVRNLGVVLVRLSEFARRPWRGWVCPCPLTSVTPLKSQAVSGWRIACEGLTIVWRWCCSTHPRSGSYHCVGGVVEWSLLMLSRLCCISGDVCGQSNFEEQDGASPTLPD